MATIFGDSYGGVQAAAQAAENADTQRQQEALRLIAQLRQQNVQNQMHEREFLQNQQNLSQQFQQRQEELDSHKILADKHLAAQAADLDFRKTAQQFTEKRLGDEFAYRKSEASDEKKRYDAATIAKNQESFFKSAQQYEQDGVALDHNDAENLWGSSLDSKQKDLIVQGTQSAYDKKLNNYDASVKMAGALNGELELTKKIAAHKELHNHFYNTSAKDKEELAIMEAQLAHVQPSLKELKGKKWLNTVAPDDTGKYVSLLEKPKTFREMYPDRFKAKESDAGSSEASPVDLGSYASWMNPQNGAQSNGTGNPLVDAGLASYPTSEPQEQPQGYAQRGMIPFVPNQVYQSELPQPPQVPVDPRTALVMELMDKGVPIEQARVIANQSQGKITSSVVDFTQLLRALANCN